MNKILKIGLPVVLGASLFTGAYLVTKENTTPDNTIQRDIDIPTNEGGLKDETYDVSDGYYSYYYSTSWSISYVSLNVKDNVISDFKAMKTFDSEFSSLYPGLQDFDQEQTKDAWDNLYNYRYTYNLYEFKTEYATTDNQICYTYNGGNLELREMDTPTADCSGGWTELNKGESGNYDMKFWDEDNASTHDWLDLVETKVTLLSHNNRAAVFTDFSNLVAVDRGAYVEEDKLAALYNGKTIETVIELNDNSLFNYDITKVFEKLWGEENV